MAQKVVYVVGLGLIGGSIALAIKHQHPDYKLIGYDYLERYRQLAVENNLVEDVCSDMLDFASEADIIILAVPIKVIKEYIVLLSRISLKEDVILTDVGSTKQEVINCAREYLKPKGINYIGGHPMAGSHKSGPLAADRYLFENAYYILTPEDLVSDKALVTFKDVLSGLKARFIEILAEEHDRVTSQVSHFPHILAASLTAQAGRYTEEHELTQHLAAGGFRDMTRIAESDPNMWTSILLSNKEAVLERVSDFKLRLSQVENILQSEDSEAIWDYFSQASKTRKNMTIHKRGGMDSSFDIFINVPDKEDVILEILELLRGISLVNIHINEENREDIYGILQLTLKTKKDQDYAYRVLAEKTNYVIKTN